MKSTIKSQIEGKGKGKGESAKFQCVCFGF